MQRSKGGVCAAAEVRREDVCGAKRAQKGTSDGSRAEAESALERVQERNEEWENDPRWNDDVDEDEQA